MSIHIRMHHTFCKRARTQNKMMKNNNSNCKMPLVAPQNATLQQQQEQQEQQQREHFTHGLIRKSETVRLVNLYMIELSLY